MLRVSCLQFTLKFRALLHLREGCLTLNSFVPYGLKSSQCVI